MSGPIARLRGSASVGHTLASVPATLIPGLCSGLGAVAIGKLTDDRTLGLVSLAVVTANFGAAVVSQATSGVALRTVASGEARAADEYRLPTLRRGALAALIAAVPALVLWASGKELGPILLLGAAWIPIQALVLFETEVQRATQRFGTASAWLSARALASWAAGVWAADRFGATASAAAMVGASAVIVVLLSARGPWPRLTGAHRSELQFVGRPITRQAFASYALGYADRYVVQALRGPAAVGLYSIGYVLGQGVVEVAMTPIIAALSPRIIREVSQDDASVARRTTRGAAAILLGLGALAIIGVVVAQALGLLAYLTPEGSSTRQLAIVTVLVAMATALQGIVRLAYAVLLAHRATLAAARSFLITLGVAAVIVPALTAVGGVIGAALATLLATGVLAGQMVWHARTHLGSPVLAPEVAG